MITREQYEELNKQLNHYYSYALKNMEEDKEGRLKENYALGVYIGMAYCLSLLGIKLEKDGQSRLEISPSSVEPAGNIG